MTDAPERGRGGGSRLEVVRAEEGHAAALAKFIGLVWNPGATAESVLAARAVEAAHNVAEPGLPPPTWIALQGGQVLGYVTTIPVRFWDGHQGWPAYWIKGLMVHPEFRNGPIGFHVLKAAVGALPRTGALAVAPPALRLFAALGYSDLGPIPNWIRPLRLTRILHRLDLANVGLAGVPGWAGTALAVAQKTGLAALFGGLGGATLRAGAAAVRLSAAGVDRPPSTEPPSAAELDALWCLAAAGALSGVVRDSGYLLHRYPAGAGSPYTWVGVRRRGELAGVAIVRRPNPEGDPRLRGIRVATLADIVYPLNTPAIGLALLGGAERAARALDADALLATCPTPAIQALLRKQCYLPITGNVHFLLRDVTGDGARFRASPEDWWLTRGDGQADEAF